MAVAERASGGGGRRIVLTAVGSLGDVHPYLALAQELRRRGHRPVVATLPGLGERVTAAGLEYAPLRAMVADQPSEELVRKVFRGPRGIAFILRELVLPSLRTAYADTLAAAAGADLLVAHPLTWATRLVAETCGLRWASTQLAPASMLSATDPPLLPGQGLLHRLPLGPRGWRLLYRFADALLRRSLRPYDALRRELGLPDTGNPMFSGARSPWLNLALFSPVFGPPQPDWGAQTVATGFPFFAQELEPHPGLDAWLAAGPPPVIFTLGSSAVMMPGDFFRESARAARRLGVRALLLGVEPAAAGMEAGSEAGSETGLGAGFGTGIGAGEDVFCLRYGSYASIFPQGAAVVHQGGVGTTAEVLRAGRPMLVVPFGADQPDNAARVVRLGVGRTVSRGQYRERRVAEELRLLLGPSTVAQAAALGTAVRAERGTERACDALERLLP